MVKGGDHMEERSFRTDDNVEEVIRRYSDMVYRLAFARAGSSFDADEIYQEVFLRYIRRKPVFRDEEHRKAWLLRVTVNCSAKLLGSAWRQRTTELTEDIMKSKEIPFETQEDLDLYRELQKLPPDYRMVIHLFYYEDLSTAGIARVLKRRESTVRTQLTRARRLLRDILEEE